MIELSPDAAVILYLGLTLACIFGVWLWQHLTKKNREALPPREVVSQCEFCCTIYLKSLSSKVSKCPKCGTFNR